MRLFFLLALITGVFAQNAGAEISKALELAKAKERTEALQLLLKLSESPSKKKESVLALEKVFGLFYSSKAQELYETALSVAEPQLDLALKTIDEALKIEPTNGTLLLQRARFLLAQGKCQTAKEFKLEYPKLIELHEPMKLVYLQGLLCSDDLSLLKSELDKLDLTKNPLKLFYFHLYLQVYFKTNNLSQFTATLNDLKSLDPAFPEPNYWNWKKLEDKDGVLTDWSQKYLNACKKLSLREKRKYLLEPMLCRRVSEVKS